jgi:hypothetical protein
VEILSANSRKIKFKKGIPFLLKSEYLLIEKKNKKNKLFSEKLKVVV